MKIHKAYETESYALFKNVDETILKLNPIIKETGYVFVSFDLAELEKKFSDLYSLPSKYNTERLLKMEEGVVISNEFYQAYINHSLGGINLTESHEIFFLKRIENFHIEVINNVVQSSDSMKVALEFKNFTTILIKKLRLFKNGFIMSPVHFQISKKYRHVGKKFTRGILQSSSRTVYSILDNEITELKNHLNQKFETNDLTRLAEMYFENCYELFDDKAIIINLITALESIFNRSNNQISHIIARHLSLIISSNKEEFRINYKRIKKIYGYRSQIVHGQKIEFKENILELTNELYDLTRKAIIHCFNLEMDKDEFFDYLNAKGF